MADPTSFLGNVDPGIAAQAPRNALALESPQIDMRDPLETAGSLVTLQRGMAELETVRGTLLAKQRAGQIMSVAPTLDEGIAALTKDPSVAGFAPEIASTLQAMSASQTAQAGERQVQAGSGLAAVMDGLLPAVNDPTMFDKLVQSRLETLSPSARAAVEAAMPGIKAALFDGLDRVDPATAAAEYQQRLAAMIVGAGFSADGVRAVTGTLAPQVISVPGAEGQTVTMQVGGPITGAQPSELSEGPTTSEAATMSGEGAIAASIESDMSAAAQAFPKMTNTLDKIIDALTLTKSGGGADVRANLGKAMQFFKNAGVTGITDEMIDGAANGNLAATQTLTGLLRMFATQQLKEAAAGTGAGGLNVEVQAFLEALGDVTNDPDTLLNFARLTREQMQIDLDRSEAFKDFKQLLKSGDPEATQYGPHGFYRWYEMHRFNQANLPQVTGAGSSLSVPTEDQIAGKPAGGAKRSLADILGE